MRAVPDPPGFHAVIARPIARVNPSDASNEYRTALAVEIPLMTLSIATVALRVYSRLTIKRKLATDDTLIILGLVCAVGRTVISCMSANDNWGYDRRGPDHAYEIPYYQHIFERRIAYIFSVTFTRLSVLAYYLRIFPPGMTSLRICCYILIGLALMLSIEVFTVLIIFCKDIDRLWAKNWMDFSGSQCFSSAVYSFSAAIGDSIIDSMIFALPTPYVWRLSKIRARQRLGLVLIFSLGLVVCVVALLQIPFIKKRQDDKTYFGTTVNILVAIQITFAIIAASLPDLRALMARTFRDFSPLHHRTMVSAARRGHDGSASAFDGERVSHGNVAASQAESKSKRVMKKPDWMRDSMPASLMSTRVSCEISHEQGRQEPEVPESAVKISPCLGEKVPKP